jgi:arylsulfatase A-like enzyme
MSHPAVSTEGSGPNLIVAILSLAISVAAADSWVALSLHPGDRVPFAEVSRSAAAVFAVVFAGYFVLCAAAAAFARIAGLKSRPLAEAAVLWTGLMFLFLLPFDGIQLGAYRQGSLPAFSALLLALVVSSLLALRTYRGVFRTRPLYAVLPILLFVAAVAYWTAHDGPGTMWFTALTLFAGLVLLFAARLGSRPARLTGVLVLLGLTILGAPAVSQWMGEPVKAAAQAAPVSTHHAMGKVVLITIDSLRRDSLGCYGSGRNDTPRIDGFAKEGLRFTRAYSAAPWTLPSLASMMTGLAPFSHGVVTMGNALPEQSLTFAERMSKAGYLTGGIGYNAHLTESKGMNQGFASYDFYPKTVPPELRSVGTRILKRAGLEHRPRRGASTHDLTEFSTAWTLGHRDNDFFLWVHYFDPHSPYAPPAEYAPHDKLVDRFGSAFNDKGLARDGTFGRTADERGWVRELYDAEVRYADHEVGRLLDALKAEGLYDDSLIVVTIDHGEEFWDHGGFEHGHTLYNELLAAPLIVKMPRAAGGGTCDTPVSLGGLMPTVLDLCGVPYDAAALNYRSFAPLLRGGDPSFDPGPLPSSGVHRYDDLESVVWGDYKYIKSVLSDQEQLFNLVDDPKERHSLVTLDPAHLEEGRKLLAQCHGRTATLPSVPAALPEDLHKELETLGYL